MPRTKRQRTYDYKCACCGSCFYSTDTQDPECDKGLGYCERCKKSLAEENEKEWERYETQFADMMNEKNRITFWKMEKEVRRGLVLTAIEDGVVQFKIRGV